jgi:hypothetical protein
MWDSELYKIMKGKQLMIEALIILVLVCLSSIFFHFIAYYKYESYREFISALYYNQDINAAISSIYTHIISGQLTEEEKNEVDQMIDHKVSPAVIALYLDHHLKIKE